MTVRRWIQRFAGGQSIIVVFAVYGQAFNMESRRTGWRQIRDIRKSTAGRSGAGRAILLTGLRGTAGQAPAPEHREVPMPEGREIQPQTAGERLMRRRSRAPAPEASGAPMQEVPRGDAQRTGTAVTAAVSGAPIPEASGTGIPGARRMKKPDGGPRPESGSVSAGSGENGSF